MGRYYNGDIEGKFWFGLQPSDAPSRFGGTEQEPAYITYDFQEEDLEEVEQEVKSIEEAAEAKVLDAISSKVFAIMPPRFRRG